jgi:arylsulfatase A-like enzyme
MIFASLPFRVLALILLVALISGCALLPAKTTQVTEVTADEILPCVDCNVILISLDTLRADRMGIYGYERNTTPNLDKQSQKAIVFENHFANGYFTLPSHMSILTSTYPLTHKLNYIRTTQNDTVPILSPNIATLAQILKQNGYSTVWIGPLRDPHLDLQRGFERGFDAFFETAFTNKGGFSMSHVRRPVGSDGTSSSTKFFWFLHSYINHAPYVYKEPFNSRFTNSTYSGNLPSHDVPIKEKQFELLLNYYANNSEIVTAIINNLSMPPSSKSEVISSLRQGDHEKYMKLATENGTLHRFVMLPFRINMDYVYFQSIREGASPEDREQLADSYDNGVYYADALLKDLFDELEHRGIMNRTMIVITSDHGDELYEHGILDHNSFYDTIIHVPLIIIAPTMHTQMRVTHLTQSIDVSPTILSLLSIPSPSSFQGKNVVGMYPPTYSPPNEFVYGYSKESMYVRSLDWKYIIAKDGTESLFHLSADPLERNNLANDTRNETAAKKKLLKEVIQTWQLGQALS